MELYFFILLPIVAYLYSSVGHGGASGYLALMALFSFPPDVMKATALTLNLFVAGIAFLAYYRGGHFKLGSVLPFLLTSVPMAYLGARVNINPQTYKIILGVVLLIAILRMVFQPSRDFESTKKPQFAIALIVGAALGFFSGMIGIGGGIILSPLLLLLHWANVKETAAASAIFILLNSASGLVGIYQTGYHFSQYIYLMVPLGVAGALAGSYSGGFKFSSNTLRYVLSSVLLMASFKLFLL